MSTTFGVKIPQTNELKAIAFRSSNEIKWLNALGPLLPDDTKVIPMDNSSQGIYTIGDIKQAVNGSEWISVSDSLPEKGGPVLAFQNREEDDDICVGMIDRLGRWIGYDWANELENVTHWMPLPKSPK